MPLILSNTLTGTRSIEVSEATKEDPDLGTTAHKQQINEQHEKIIDRLNSSFDLPNDTAQITGSSLDYIEYEVNSD